MLFGRDIATSFKEITESFTADPEVARGKLQKLSREIANGFMQGAGEVILQNALHAPMLHWDFLRSVALNFGDRYQGAVAAGTESEPDIAIRQAWLEELRQVAEMV